MLLSERAYASAFPLDAEPAPGLNDNKQQVKDCSSSAIKAHVYAFSPDAEPAIDSNDNHAPEAGKQHQGEAESAV